MTVIDNQINTYDHDLFYAFRIGGWKYDRQLYRGVQDSYSLLGEIRAPGHAVRRVVERLIQYMDLLGNGFGGWGISLSLVDENE